MCRSRSKSDLAKKGGFSNISVVLVKVHGRMVIRLAGANVAKLKCGQKAQRDVQICDQKCPKRL